LLKIKGKCEGLSVNPDAGSGQGGSMWMAWKVLPDAS